MQQERLIRQIDRQELEISALNTLARYFQLLMAGDFKGMKKIYPHDPCRLKDKLGVGGTFCMCPVASPVICLDSTGEEARLFWMTPAMGSFATPQGFDDQISFSCARCNMVRRDGQWLIDTMQDEADPAAFGVVESLVPRPGAAPDPISRDLWYYADYAALRNLMGTLSFRFRANRFEGVRALFAQGVEISLSDDAVGSYHGVEAVGDYLTALTISSKSGNWQLLPLTSQLVEVTEARETATGLWYATGTSQVDGQLFWDYRKVYGTFVNQGGAWRIQSLQFITELTASQTECWSDFALNGSKKPPLAHFPPPTAPAPAVAAFRSDTTPILATPIPQPRPSVPPADPEDELALRARRLADYVQVSSIMGRYSMLHYAGQHQATFDFYATRPDIRCELGPVGVYEGPEAVHDFFVGQHAAIDAPGIRRMHPVALPVLEIAADGQTARGLWFTPGLEGDANAPTWSAWFFDNYACDFILEDGVWKWWHFHLVEEIHCDFGIPFSQWASTPHPSYESIIALDEANGIYHAKPTRPPGNFIPYTNAKTPTLQVSLPAPYDTWDDIPEKYHY